MTASTASDNSPAISQVFRKREPVSAASFGLRAAGAGTSIRAVPVATGLFIVELRFAPQQDASGMPGKAIDKYQNLANSSE